LLFLHQFSSPQHPEQTPLLRVSECQCKDSRIYDACRHINLCVCSSFPVQVAVYTRQELNIRITTNFLLALAANLDPTKPHVRRYFCAAVQLPSDWLEIVRIYSTVSLSQHQVLHPCLPTCLKKAMVDKFKQFSEYQLAKYNTRKHRYLLQLQRASATRQHRPLRRRPFKERRVLEQEAGLLHPTGPGGTGQSRGRRRKGRRRRKERRRRKRRRWQEEAWEKRGRARPSHSDCE
uniref:TROVE domain-containing protein n=1 Tax=Xiphophorus couchianus TaxID=32473 RepID=A0A3B5MZJ5_9TELE